MAERKPKTFVGIAEVAEIICGTVGYYYSLVDAKTGAKNYTNLRQVGKDLVALFADKVRENITFSPPKKVRGAVLCLSAYHPLSVLEADRLNQEIERYTRLQTVGATG